MDIKTKYLILGGESGFMGKELGSEKIDGKSSFQEYKHGRIYSSPAGVHVVQGKILKEWLRLKSEGVDLGFPTTDEREVSDGRGSYSEFENGVIYWSPAHEAQYSRIHLRGVFRD